MDNATYSTLKPGRTSYGVAVLLLAVLVLTGAYSAYTMEHAGHHITGMNNQVIWGLPHVFAVTLVLAASGALNAASFSSVFGAQLYKPYARLSVVLAVTLLVGGLAVLVLDLGRPDRLVIAITHYNFRSIFAWNIFLYTGFIAIGIVYLWMMMERRFNRYVTVVGVLAFSWRIVLTTGTGSIFGFLVGRDALDSALIAPLFIALSLVLGTAFFVLVLALISSWNDNAPATGFPAALVDALSKLLIWFVVSVAYFSIVQHVTNLYVAEHQAVERFTLVGPFSVLFWLGHIGIGVVLPLALLIVGSAARRRLSLLWASIASILGSMVLVYVVIVGSQKTPQRLFPDKTVLASTFGDAEIATYTPSAWEWGLGIGGMAMALFLCLLVLRLLPFTPEPR